MKKFVVISLLSFIFASNIYAYKDMSKVSRRARDLNMRKQDYAFAMAIAGTFTGSMFGLFLWKAR